MLTKIAIAKVCLWMVGLACAGVGTPASGHQSKGQQPRQHTLRYLMTFIILI